MNVLRDKAGRSNIRLIILVFVVLSGIAAALLYFPPIPTKTEPEKTSGDITFTDSRGNPLIGAIELSGDGLSSGLKPNVNFISWTNVPNARIYYNALDTKDVSVNLRISGNSLKGKVVLENYAITIPNGVNVTAPGTLVKYVEVSAMGVSFVGAEIAIKYTDVELAGLDEKNLAIYRYDITAQAWSELPTKVDAVNNILSTTVNSLSIFAVSTRIPQEIEVRDTNKVPIVSDIKTYDEAKTLKKEAKASKLSSVDVPDRGELEVDALASKNVAVKLKIEKASGGEVVLDNYGKNNPVSVPLPGKVVKFVEIGANNISFSYANITIRYSDSELNGGSEEDLTIYHWNGASWDAVPTVIDAANKTLSTTTTSLSQWGVATSVTIVANSTGNIGHKGTLESDGTADNEVLASDIKTATVLTSTELNALSSLDDVTSSVSSAGSAGDDEYVRLNMTLNGVLSVNYVIVKVQMRTLDGAKDALRFGAFNYSTGKWIKLNGTTATLIFTNLTYNISSAAEKNAYLSLSNNVLNLSLLAWGMGSSADTVDVSYFEATVNYNQLAELSGYVKDNSTGLPINGATVTTNTGLTNITNASGFYKLNAANGTHIVTASKTGYIANSTSVTISGADSLNNNITLSPITGGAQLIIFTDKSVYLLGEPYDTTSGGNAWTDKTLVTGIQVKVFAAIIDDDGNIIRSLSGSGLALNASLKDNARYYHNASMTYHSDTEATNGKWWNNTFNTNFVDPDGDGIWETTFNVSDAEQLNIAQGASRADHFNITITVNETARNLIQTTYVLFSRNGCAHGSKGITALTAQIHIENGNHAGPACTFCHWGWEYKMGVHGNNTALGNNVSTQPAIPNTATAWNYNTGTEEGTGTSNYKNAGRSDICVACHNQFTTNPDVLDMDTVTVPVITDANGDGINDNDRPSCSWSQGATAEGLWAGVGCHNNGPANASGTIIEKVSLKNSTHYFLNWSWKGKGAGKSYAHNRTDSSVACELCHGSHEVKGLPNASASLTNINEQCWLCHNITGGYLNITSNGGKSVRHNSTDCKICHRNFTTDKLDVHDVPRAVMGNCSACHDVGGRAGAGRLVNFTAMNSSNAIHSKLNINANSPSGFNATNFKCWACHGNSSEPAVHPDNYESPYNCTQCHIQGAGQNFNYSPNNTLLNVTQHYWNGTSIITTAATSCYACHNRTEMMLGSFDPDGPAGVYRGTNGGNNSSSHYGRKRGTDLRMWNSGLSANCSYCHQNSSTAFNTAMVDSAYNSSIQNHSVSASSPACFNSSCHDTGWIHNSTLRMPAFALPNSSFCTGVCHATKERHNGTVNCTQCHLNTSKSIHPVRYLQQDGSNWSTVNTTAVNCTNCHQNSTFWSGAPIIPDPLKHSSNLTNGSIWGNYWTSENSSCYYCHNNTKHNATALGKVNALLNTNNTREGSLTTTEWCADCHYNDSANADYKGNQWNPVPPVITINNTGKARWENHSDYVTTGYKDSNCKSCHALNGSYASTSLNYSHSLNEGVAGGPNCIECHNLVTGLANGAPSGINFTAANLSVHNGTNSNNATGKGYAPVIGACWACHDTDGNVTSGHPANNFYKTPKNCTDCHLANGTYYNQSVGWGLNVTVSEHYYGGDQIIAGNSSSNISSCINCHENVSEMIIYNNDTNYGSFVGDGVRLTGGNLSFYHYGANRSDIRSWDSNRSENCSYCHQNVSTNFSIAMSDPGYSKNVSNHSITYSSTNPSCLQCHNSGWLHNSTLTKPSFTLPNSSYCLTCHGTPGSINTTIKNLERHNVTSPTALNCTQCHLNDSRSIHPVRYLQQDGSNFSTSRTNAVNCTTCHQSGLSNFSNATRIPVPMNHSTNIYNGSLWNGSQPSYWTNTSQQSSCDYCHGSIALHNNSGLGNITRVQGSNIKKQSLDISRWCANCHYKNAPDYAGTSFSPEPPEILNASGKVPATSRDGTTFTNHSNYFTSGYNDSVCKSCHNNNLSASATSLNFSHNVNIGSGGAPNCIQCHNLVTGLSGGAPVGVNFTAVNLSVHYGINSQNATNWSYVPVIGACWACHDTDGNVSSGHPDKYKTPKTCTDCHLANGTYYNQSVGWGLNVTVSEHYYGGDQIIAGNSSSNISSCINCHENVSEMILYNNDTDTGQSFVGDGIRLVGGNMSFYHYGANRTADLRIGATANCSYCHQNPNTNFTSAMANPGYNASISNHSMSYSSSNPNCTQCHNTGWIHNSTLTRPSFTLPNSSFCLSCHGANSSGQVNFTGSVTGIKEKHNNTVNCTACHINTTKDIHPVNYRQNDNATWSTSNASAVNCTTCHQGSGLGGLFANATKIPGPMSHSDNPYNGSMWNESQPGYWTNTSQLSSCVYCHTNSSLHNASGLGKVAQIQYNNTKNQSITGDSHWCANCHYNSTYSNITYRYNGTAYSSVPPNISQLKGITANDGKTSWYNHTGFANYSDAKCKECHGLLAKKAYSAEFVHNVSKGGGGANCISCHDKGGSGAPDDKRINASDMKLGVHKNLNSNASNVTALDAINKACWACHGSGEEPGGHPTNYRSPYACIDCHNRTSNLTFTTNATIITDLNKKKVAEHIQDEPPNYNYENISSTRNNSAVNCTFCHNKSLVAFNDTASITIKSNVSHYATKTALVSPTTNCALCHKTPANASKYYANITRHPAKTQDVSYCKYCHNTTNASSLHSQSLDFRFGASASIHGGIDPGTGIKYWGFDWEEDDWKEPNSPSREDEGCAACHTFVPVFTSKICENCHLPDNSSLFTGPNTGILNLSASINESIPRVYSHTNYSSVNVPNKSVPLPYQTTASSCYGFANSCHGIDYINSSNAGGYFAYNYLFTGEPFVNDTYHFTDTIDRLPNTTRCLFCHNQSDTSVRNAWGNATQINASTMFDATTNETCYTCHTQDNSTPADFHASTLLQGGGPGCLGCHNISNKQKYTKAYGYIDAVNYSNSIHANINQANASIYGINASCWACHNSSGTAVANNTHPDNRSTPYICTDCHLAGGKKAGAYNATIIYNHYRNGTNIRALDNKTSDIASCIGCHENVSGMRILNSDTDYGSFTGDGIGLTGGNTSFYHYGANRSSFNRTAGSYGYCIYCHRNETGEFNITFQYAANRSIANHSSFSYNSSNPSCSEGKCHNSTNSTLHGSQLARPNLTLHNSSYCLSCHGKNSTGGTNYTGAVTSYKEKHNNTVDCMKCHLNSSKSIHPVRYLQEGGLTWSTSNTSAVNCTNCHQGGLTNFSNAPKVANPMAHSENVKNGSIWNSTNPYWTNTSQQSMCNYCHGDTRHNATPLGRPSNWSGSNTVNSSTTSNSTWCSGCHYQGYISGVKSYNNMVQTFANTNESVPPEITNHTSYAPYGVSDYYNHSLTPDYNDSTCEDCHGRFLQGSTLIKDFVHNVSTGTCKNCHFNYSYMNSVSKPDKFVNQSMFEASPHGGLRCEDCHTKGHNNIGARKACEDCHAVAKQIPIQEADRGDNRHNITAKPSASVVNITSCTTCHDETLYSNATSNFGYNKTRDCNYCHTYPDETYS